MPEEREHGEGRGQHHHGGLGEQQDPPALVPVGDHAAEGRQEEDGNLAGEPDGAEEDRGPGQPIDQPRLGHGLHPGPDERDELPHDEDAKVPVAERMEHVLR